MRGVGGGDDFAGLFAPVEEHGHGNRQQNRTDKQADKAEGENTAQDPHQNQHDRQVAADADEIGTDEVIEHADDDRAIDRHEDGRIILAFGYQPEGRRDPHQRRAKRNDREEERDQAKEACGGNACDPEPDGGESTLRNRGAENPVNHADHGFLGKLQQMLATFARERLNEGADALGGLCAVAEKEIDENDAKRQIDEAFANRACNHQHELAGRASILGEHIEQLLTVFGIGLPRVAQLIAKERQLYQPLRRILGVRAEGGDQTRKNMREVFSDAAAEKHQRNDKTRGQKHSHQRGGKRRAVAELGLHPCKSGPGAEREDEGEHHRRDEGLQNDETSDQPEKPCGQHDQQAVQGNFINGVEIHHPRTLQARRGDGQSRPRWFIKSVSCSLSCRKSSGR